MRRRTAHNEGYVSAGLIRHDCILLTNHDLYHGSQLVPQRHQLDAKRHHLAAAIKGPLSAELLRISFFQAKLVEAVLDVAFVASSTIRVTEDEGDG